MPFWTEVIAIIVALTLQEFCRDAVVHRLSPRNGILFTAVAILLSILVVRMGL
jgi:hypothetical protein